MCCDHGDDRVEVLGRGTIRETDVYSTACAIENLWLAARAEGLGIGWVSFYRPDDLRRLLSIPDSADPIAYLCVGWPDERPVRPGLETAGWSARLPLDAVVMRERWHGREGGDAPVAAATGPDRWAAVAARDRLDQLVKPAGSLGMLEPLIERWAASPAARPRPDPGGRARLRRRPRTRPPRNEPLRGRRLARRWPRRRPAASPRSASSPARAVTRSSSPTWGSPDRPRPASGTARSRAGTADMTLADALSESALDEALAAGAALAGELIDAAPTAWCSARSGSGTPRPRRRSRRP